MGTSRRPRHLAPAPALSIEALYDENAASLLSWFQSRTFSSEVAGDLFAEAFAVAIESQHRYDPERGEPGAWLWGIARNLLRQYVRSAQVERRARERLAMTAVVVTDDDLDRVDARVDATDLVAALMGSVDELSPNVAAAVRARVLEDKPYDQVAQECGCSVGAARVRVTRGLAALLDHVHLELDDEGVTR